jgi:hypothetical protein
MLAPSRQAQIPPKAALFARERERRTEGAAAPVSAAGALLVVRLRQIGMPGVARTMGVSRGLSTGRPARRSDAVGIDGLPDRPRFTIAIGLAALARRQLLLGPRHRCLRLPVPRLGPRGKKRLSPRAFNATERGHRAGGNARRGTAPTPQSKPVTHASRLVAHGAPSVAVGLRSRVLAAGPARVPQYSDRTRRVDRASKVRRRGRHEEWARTRSARLHDAGI